MDNLFFELTGVLVIAGLAAYFLHLLKQPAVIGYMLIGLIIGPLGWYKLQNGDILYNLSEIGITLLLFMVGLNLDLSQLKRIGKAAVAAGVGQVLFTTLFGYLIIRLLGFGNLSAWYMAVALTFSSTIIIVKMLLDKQDLHSLYGKLAVGIFLVQDLIAIFILIALSTVASPEANWYFPQFSALGNIIISLAKIFMIIMIVRAIVRKIFPKFLASINRSDELLLLFALAWALGLGAFFSSPLIGFNASIGGFIAGLALANSGSHYQISGRIKSISDFFIIIFFVVLGSKIVLSDMLGVLIPALILSLFVIVGNAVIITAILSYMGYKPRTSFFTGLTVAQISEFSLKLMAVGLVLGHVTQRETTVITLVAIFTIALSTYAVAHLQKIYTLISPYTKWFSFDNHSKEPDLNDKPPKNHIVIVGAHRLGSNIIEAFSKSQKDFIIIDFDPNVIAHYHRRGITSICGDVTDPYIQEEANINKASMIISTIPDFHDTLALIEALKISTKKIRLIVSAQDEFEAVKLYAKKVDYVLMPHYIGGLHLADIVENSAEPKKLMRLKQDHQKTIQKLLKDQ